MRRWRELPLVLLGACAAAPTHTVQLVVTLDAGVSDASVDAVIVDVAARDTAQPLPVKTASEPWCNDKYDVTPCIFQAYGSCWVRDRQPPTAAGDYAYSYCPPGAAPSFMSRARACGRRSTEPVVQRTASYVRGPDLARCSAIETKWSNVAHEERACATDADCALVKRGCFLAPLTKKAAALPKYDDPPCPNPAAGMCSPQNETVQCVAGCCILGGMSAFGTLDAAYPKVTPP